MAIAPKDEFPSKIDTSDPTGYPQGKAQNITAPGDGTGTPWIAKVVNDIFGLQQALLAAVGAVPSGTPDKVGASQYLDAMNTIIDDAITAAAVGAVRDTLDVSGETDENTFVDSTSVIPNTTKTWDSDTGLSVLTTWADVFTALSSFADTSKRYTRVMASATVSSGSLSDEEDFGQIIITIDWVAATVQGTGKLIRGLGVAFHRVWFLKSVVAAGDNNYAMTDHFGTIAGVSPPVIGLNLTTRTVTKLPVSTVNTDDAFITYNVENY